MCMYNVFDTSSLIHFSKRQGHLQSSTRACYFCFQLQMHFSRNTMFLAEEQVSHQRIFTQKSRISQNMAPVLCQLCWQLKLERSIQHFCSTEA
mmetsp:Transcript_959/g.2180  ORF Transcript_959/g.2180 Transcript_959/m.2180 type:complete len:93 (-) Transcript_959:461-739(-)